MKKLFRRYVCILIGFLTYVYLCQQIAKQLVLSRSPKDNSVTVNKSHKYVDKLVSNEEGKSTYHKQQRTINPDWFQLYPHKSNVTNFRKNSKETVQKVKPPDIRFFTPNPKSPKIQEQDFFKKQDTKVNPYRYGFLINNSNCDSRTEILIIVHSYHPYVDRRNAIRRTWGSLTVGQTWPHDNIKAYIKLVFILGLHTSNRQNEALKIENQVYQDIIMGNFTDSYDNMTLKSLLGLKYFSEYCSSAQHLLKSDDDMFINLPFLIRLLRTSPIKRGIMGPLNVHSLVYRGGKWAVPYELYPFKYYPPFEAGAAYVISADICKELFDTAEYVPSFSVDDAYITGVLGRIINVTHIWQQGFAFWTGKPPKPCDLLLNLVVTGTKMKPNIMLNTWDKMKTTNKESCKMPPSNDIHIESRVLNIRHPPLDKP